MNLGISGRLTRASINARLTPLFLFAALAAGILALLTIPREEEPQISVSMVDIAVNADGLRAPDATELITKPLETIVKAINGVEHVYSQTQDDRVLVTARFTVGTSEDDAILRVHAKLRANFDRIPTGIAEPLVIGRGINDVAIVTLTLSPNPDAGSRYTEADLYRIGDKLRTELTKVNDVGFSFMTGGAPPQIRVEPDPGKLSLYGVTLQQLAAKLGGANRAFLAGGVRDAGLERSVTAGQTLNGIPDIGLLLLTTRDGRPVYVRDVARIVVAPAETGHRVWQIAPDRTGRWQRAPAMTLAFAKRAGANAVVVARAILARAEALRGSLIPADVALRVTRDYGATANDKANELLLHLGIATLSIVSLIGVAVGVREAAVTAVVIPVTILLTLFAADMMGYTINRVSLFALIFSIGILVDDAIVVVENIARHWGMHDGRDRAEAAIDAVAEVGNPTVVATLTVVAALLPMLFVSGLMGPYMAPIPVNASAAMLFSFFIAMVLAPWLMLRFAGKQPVLHGQAEDGGRFGRFYRRFATPVIATRKRAWIFLISVGIATLLAGGLFYTEMVTVKLLPFDNKSELDLVTKLPEGATLEDTERLLFQLAGAVRAAPEVTAMQAYAGTAAPFNFNGLVRHYYLRDTPELGELQLTLAPAGQRRRSSHHIALALRHALDSVALPRGAIVKIVEVPPGPPVLATLLAEIYGADAVTRRAEAEEVKRIFACVPFIVDIDDSYGLPRPRLRVSIDEDKLEFFGVEQSDVYDTIQLLLHGEAIGYSHRGAERMPLPIVMALPRSAQAFTERLLSTPIPANVIPGSRKIVELGDVVSVTREAGSPVLFRRDGRSADMVMAELAGSFEAPIYGMLAVDKAIESHDWHGLPKPAVRLHGQPTDESHPTLLWDGEWDVTYVTFRDMGAAFGVALLGIYILVVAQFRSFLLPLVILTPVPLTLIGIVLGHALFGGPFTATSMIGFIALAGIIVRNSILLVDFIRHGAASGETLREIVLKAGAVRFKPIVLTALSAMIGAATILLDPIFQGLALSLLLGLASSTVLTVLVIPAIYVVLRDPEGRAAVKAPL